MKANEELFSDEKILGCREFRAHYTLVPSCIIIWIINAKTNCNIYVDVSYSKTNLTIWNIWEFNILEKWDLCLLPLDMEFQHIKYLVLEFHMQNYKGW